MKKFQPKECLRARFCLIWPLIANTSDAKAILNEILRNSQFSAIFLSIIAILLALLMVFYLRLYRLHTKIFKTISSLKEEKDKNCK